MDHAIHTAAMNPANAPLPQVDKNDRIDLLNLSWNSCGSCLGKIAAAMAINQGKGAMVPRPDDEIKKDVQALVDDGFKKQEDFKYVRGNETRVIPRQFWQQEAAFPACTIVTLNLSHNRVGDAGCEEMVRVASCCICGGPLMISGLPTVCHRGAGILQGDFCAGQFHTSNWCGMFPAFNQCGCGISPVRPYEPPEAITSSAHFTISSRQNCQVMRRHLLSIRKLEGSDRC